MWNAVVAYLHYLSFMVLFAALFVEAALLHQRLDNTGAKRILFADLSYGLAAVALLVTGFLRFSYFDKGMQFYLANPVFYLKVGLFLTVGLVSIFPTVEFLSWRERLKRGEGVELTSEKYRFLKQVLHAELVAVALIPLLAALMARGLGSGLS